MSEHVNTFTTENYNCNYYEINSFNSKFNNTYNKYPKICHLNIRSLNLHKHELVAYLNCINCNFDIILLTECGHALHASIEQVFDNYNFHITPPNSNKGGAGILIRKDMFKNVETMANNVLLTCTCKDCKCKVENH